MIDTFFYWLGAKGCTTIGTVTEQVTTRLICTSQQNWSLGAALFSTTLLLVCYVVVRRQR
jgi:predicted Na+-dependent transporter